MKNSEEILRNLWDTIKQINICHKGKREKRAESVFNEIMVKNLQKFDKWNDIQFPET